MKLKLKELNSGYVAVKKLKRFTPKQKAISVIAAVLAVAFFVTYLFSSLGVFSVSSVLAKTVSSIDGSNKRFPLSVVTEKIVNIKVMGEGLLVLTDKDATYYDSNGKQVYNTVHAFAKPAVSVNGDKAIIFDRNGKGYTLLNEKKAVLSGEESGVIVSAEYGASGNYAFGIRGEKSTGELHVYSRNGTEIFAWNCAYENITSIALDNSGKYAGVAVYGAENGDCFTGVHYFGFDYKDELNGVKIAGTSPFALEFTKNSTLTLFGDNGVYKITKKSEEAESVSEYYNPEFNSFGVCANGRYSVTLAKYGSSNTFCISLYGGNGKLKKEIAVEKEIKAVSMSDKYIFALAENEILVYNQQGRLVNKITVTGKLYGIYPTDDYIYIYSLDKITRCFTFDNRKEVSV